MGFYRAKNGTRICAELTNLVSTGRDKGGETLGTKKNDNKGVVPYSKTVKRDPGIGSLVTGKRRLEPSLIHAGKNAHLEGGVEGRRFGDLFRRTGGGKKKEGTC